MSDRLGRKLMKKLICVLFLLILVLTGCAKPMMPDEESAVKEVVFSVIDGEEISCDESQTEKILHMYAQCKSFKRNRDNAGVTPPNPVEIVVRYKSGRSITIYHPGTHKIGIRDENGESWFAKNEELYEYLVKLQGAGAARQEGT